jgi:hypothetical protein
VICPRCNSKAITGLGWSKTRTVKSIYGSYKIETQVLKCECGRYLTGDNEYAPMGCRWDWKTIEYVVEATEGHTELSRRIAREYGVYLPMSSIHELRSKYNVH